MSILIKGMEMPKHAGVNEDKDTVYRCIVIAHPDNSAEIVIDTEFASPYDNGHNIKRYPLVEVPTPHGRLIDCERATFPTAFRYNTNDYAKGWNACIKAVQTAPTIIEAEVSEGCLRN